MKGALIANLSGKKFFVLILFSIIAQIICILASDFVTPIPATNKNILASACKDDRVNDSKPDLQKWYYTKGKGGCDVVDMFMYDNKIQDKVYQVVYTVQIPLPYNRYNSNYSKWLQSLIGILHIDLINRNQFLIPPRLPLLLDVKLGYRNKDDSDDDWKLHSSSRIYKTLECFICDEKRKHDYYDCLPMSLFELNSLSHDYYLLNIRFPRIDSNSDINRGVNQMTDLWVNVVNDYGSFTEFLIRLKTFFFPIVISTVAWYWRQIHISPKSPTLLQCMLLVLASALSVLNIPWEYLTLRWNIPVMTLLNDFRQGIFYIVLLSFLLIFVNEHLTIPDYDKKNNLQYYWRHLSAIFVGSFLLFILNIFTEILAGFYLLSMSCKIWKIFKKINIHQQFLPIITYSTRRFHCDHLMFRSKIILMATLLCASLTLVEFVLRPMVKDQTKWDEVYGWETTPKSFIIVYGMWNIYSVTLLCLYAPSHKKMAF